MGETRVPFMNMSVLPRSTSRNLGLVLTEKRPNSFVGYLQRKWNHEAQLVTKDSQGISHSVPKFFSSIFCVSQHWHSDLAMPDTPCVLTAVYLDAFALVASPDTPFLLLCVSGILNHLFEVCMSNMLAWKEYGF